MPTNRTKRTRKNTKPTISPALLKYFRGEPYEADDEGAADVFLMELRPEMSVLWQEHRITVLNDWISQNPCTRPYGFWRFDVPINGGDYEGASIESQAAFLKRHGLLTPAERTYLKKTRGLDD